jgi:SNF2 family DNA or RNA helicase
LQPQLIDNLNVRLVDDLKEQIKPGSRVAIVAACFSIFAFHELKQQLNQVEELRFIFNSPAFTTDSLQQEEPVFRLERQQQERGLHGTAFELQLKNGLTQKAIARECAEWIIKKVRFLSNTTRKSMMGFAQVDEASYAPLTGFTTADLGITRSNAAYTLITKHQAPNSQRFLKLFDELWYNKTMMKDVTEEVLRRISIAYQENSPEFIYFVALYNIFSAFLEDLNEDHLPNELLGFKDSKIWQMLYNFQRDAALAIINKLEKYNGCILADSVGLGKTFTSLAVIKYYEMRNKSVLVLCPKKLQNNWNTFKDNYLNNPIAQDRLNYDVLFHTDLSRREGMSNGMDLGRINWGNYDLLVIDESHNFRNGGQIDLENGRENRYQRLMNQVIRKGVRTRVLMLSATPVNTRFTDLRNQLALAYEGDASKLDRELDTQRTVETIFRQAQAAFNEWSRLEAEERSTIRLLRMLDFDFFQLLDAVTIARSRKHIKKYYDTAALGSFPQRMKPLSIMPPLTSLPGAIGYHEIFEQLMALTHAVYTPTHYILPSRQAKYAQLDAAGKGRSGITQAGREQGIRRLTAINLMKRLESSVYSFDLTLSRIQTLIEKTLQTIAAYRQHHQSVVELEDLSLQDFDEDDQNTEYFTVGQKVRIEIKDMDYLSWQQLLQQDQETLALLHIMVKDITPKVDSKLQRLLKLLEEKVQHPINPGNQKVLIFTAFADTAEYLYAHVSQHMKRRFGMDTAMITGSVEGRSTIKGLKCNLNTVLTCFSPLSKDKQLLMPDNPASIDILIGTDCISEGQNLQDCDYVINYDIHWNPVRIIQRFGRIDRIGSHNSVIQLVNFWPNMTLDEYINLKARVESRMKIVNLAATGDDNLLSPEEKIDLEYRKQQLQRLKDEVVDMEDMQSGISITDLGLNDFRMDLVDYIKRNPDLEHAPLGLYAVAPVRGDAQPGTLFVLRKVENNQQYDRVNLLHPFYLVYVAEDGSILCDHVSPKKALDTLRLLCLGQTIPHEALCEAFNRETRDGHDMRKQTKLLQQAVEAIIQVKQENDIISLFKPGGTTIGTNDLQGLNDFELITFLVVKENG